MPTTTTTPPAPIDLTVNRAADGTPESLTVTVGAETYAVPFTASCQWANRVYDHGPDACTYALGGYYAGSAAQYQHTVSVTLTRTRVQVSVHHSPWTARHHQDARHSFKRP